MEAFPAPFGVTRMHNRMRLTNVGEETLLWVRCIVDGAAISLTPPTPRLEPGASLDVFLRGDDLELDCLVVAQWLRPDGVKLLCAIAP